ncbi:MFS family permease [Amorphus suaedae]
MHTASPQPGAGDWRAIGAAIASMTAVGLSISLGMPLLSLVLEARGVSTAMIGLNSAVGGIASMLVPLAVPAAVSRLGTARVAMTALAVMAATFPFFHLIDALWAWFPLRFLFYAAATTTFAVGEFWINALAPDGKRGLAIGIYATMLSLGFAAGPAILGLVGTAGATPFLIGTGIFLLALVPMAVARNKAPSGLARPKTNVVTFLMVAPAAVFAVMAFGAVEAGGLALLPVYGLELGFTPREAALLVSAMALGNVVTQIPLGLMADRVDRRVLLLVCALVGVAGALAMPLAAGDLTALLALLFVWGGMTGGLYTVGLTHLGARFSGTDLAAANSAFVMMYAAGMLVGPALIGISLDLWPPNGLPVAVAGFFAAYAVLAAVRIAQARAA